MSKITTYGGLKQAVQLWLNRNDAATINSIPMFINFAENDFQRLVRLPQYEIIATTSNGKLDPITDAVPESLLSIKLPKTYFEMKHFSINGIPYNRLDVETFNRIKSGVSDSKVSSTQITTSSEESAATVTRLQGTTTRSHFFCRKGNELFMLPALKSGDEVEMIYYEAYPEMNDDGLGTDSLDIAPDIMLYLSLRHAAVFLRDNEQAQFWEQKATDAAGALIRRLDDIEWSGSSLVVPGFES